MSASPFPWYTDPSRIAALYRWLDDRDELPDDVPYFIERIDKWTPEYERMCSEQDRDMCTHEGPKPSESELAGKIGYFADRCPKEAAETVNGKRFCAKHAADALRGHAR